MPLPLLDSWNKPKPADHVYGMEYALHASIEAGVIRHYWKCTTCDHWVTDAHIAGRDHQRRLAWLMPAGVPYGQQQLALPSLPIVAAEIVADERSTQLESHVRIATLEKRVEDSRAVESKLIADAERITENIVADAERITKLEKLVADQARALRILETNTVAAVAETTAEKLVDVGGKIDSEQIAKLEKRVAALEEELESWWKPYQADRWTSPAIND